MKATYSTLPLVRVNITLDSNDRTEVGDKRLIERFRVFLREHDIRRPVWDEAGVPSVVFVGYFEAEHVPMIEAWLEEQKARKVDYRHQ